ncbi:uncharacterized protein LOC113135438 isoform X1 [Mastacembelus armatus]|uniref:Uncharacterized LOC113135438 n=1 Tax=Mastacembelus armatus TaxID=205130 RepID=A0A7N8XJJ6_9TELE|nr:uncharacterized protein LOC113135438 isoform X1 [Mastacembelus armatus]
MADGAAFVEESASPAQSPLVAVTFQRNVQRKQKYLEAEPKALGITQIGLSVFQLICMSVFLAKGLSPMETDIPVFVLSLLVIIAGSVAIAAQNLHVPTLRACLGMQIVSCGASVFNMICTLVNMGHLPSLCWFNYYDNTTHESDGICHKIQDTHSHFYAEGALIHAALLAISVTLAAYCCKVVKCCTPAPKMPVITVHTSPAQQ